MPDDMLGIQIHFTALRRASTDGTLYVGCIIAKYMDTYFDTIALLSITSSDDTCDHTTERYRRRLQRCKDIGQNMFTD